MHGCTVDLLGVETEIDFFYTGIKFDKELINKIPLVKDIIDHKVKFRDIIVQNSAVTDAELGCRETIFKL